jgi:hypothetical protein
MLRKHHHRLVSVVRQKSNVIDPRIGRYYVRLPIDPAAAESADDAFRLFSEDGGYDVTRTVKDDAVAGDAGVDLVFTEMPSDRNYSFEVDPGKEGESYLLFDAVHFEDLALLVDGEPHGGGSVPLGLRGAAAVERSEEGLDSPEERAADSE